MNDNTIVPSVRKRKFNCRGGKKKRERKKKNGGEEQRERKRGREAIVIQQIANGA